MKRNSKIAHGCAAITLALVSVPLIAQAQEFEVCSGPDCDFNSLIQLANVVVQFLMFKVMVPLAAIGFMFAGGKLVLNQDKEGAWSEAKQSFEYIGIGFLIVIGAFLFTKFVIYQFLDTDAGFTLFLLD